MGAGFLIGLGVVVGIFVADHRLYHRNYMKKLENEKRDRLNRLEYNRTHLPSTEPPSLSPDWSAVEEFVEKTRFDFTNESECYSYHCLADRSYYEKRSIPKSNFDSDTLMLIDLLRKDVDWFYGHRLGSVAETISVLNNFLREKYPKLSDKSVDWICFTYGKNDR